MSQESVNPYAPPESIESPDRVAVLNPDASLEILRLATRASIIALVAFIVFPLAPLIAPIGIYLARRARDLIDQTGAGPRYISTTNGATFVCYLSLAVFLAFMIMVFA